MEYNGEIRVNLKKLIEKITKKKTSEDRVSHAVSQLKDCIDYVTEHEVKLSIEGLHHKFIIHAEYEKSRKFQKLVERYIELTKPTGLTHSTWSVLHLLFKLSYRPTERPDYLLEGQLFENIQVAADDFDWGKFLLGEELVQSLPKTDDVWSDSEEDQFIDETETIISKPLGIDGERLSLFSSSNVNVPTIKFDLHKLIQDNYWEKKVWSEYQVQREVLWALHSKDGTSALFQLNADGVICPRSISIPSTPSHSLKNILLAFCPLLQGLKQLSAYIEDVSSAMEQTYTLTHQAYADGLSVTLGQFYNHIAAFEQRLVQQKITTTLAHLHSHLNSWKLVIPSLAEIHCRITRIPASTSNHIRAACLLSELFIKSSEAQVTSYSSLYPVLLHLLYTSLEPILNIIDRWLTHGQIVDTFQEFGIKRNIAVSLKSENFWHDSVLTRSDHHQLDFLLPVMNSDIMLAGRSVELLSHLGYLPSLTSSSLHNGLHHAPSLIEIFRERFNDRFSSSPSNILSSEICIASSNLPSLSNEEFKSDNPLLNSAFSCLNKNLQRNIPHQKIPEIKTKGLHTPPEFFPLAPLLEYSLLEPIRCKQRLVSKTLLQVLYNQCNLRLHILALRCIHLLQAGDLMDRFGLQLFQKMDLGDKWDSESMLTLSLINCLQSNQLSQSSAYISVNFREHIGQPTLSHLQINYAVPWPVNLIINQESLKLYNSIFRFLLSIKHALTSLQRLSFKSLSALKNGICDGENVQQTSEQAELLPLAVRQHRLQLLRAWLIHFISSLDYYIMECVLENAHARFDSALKNASHLGEIADCHQKYINSVYSQCMQQPSAAFLRDAINEVLSTSIMVVSAWNTGISTKQLINLEEKYVQHHQFVAAVLNTDAAHSMLPHVETLAAALIHSCPTELK